MNLSKVSFIWEGFYEPQAGIILGDSQTLWWFCFRSYFCICRILIIHSLPKSVISPNICILRNFDVSEVKPSTDSSGYFHLEVETPYRFLANLDCQMKPLASAMCHLYDHGCVCVCTTFYRTEFLMHMLYM